MDIDKINIFEKLAQFDDRWSPKVVAELNGQQVKLAKIEGEFVWHHHDEEDELFLVIRGGFDMHFRDRIVSLAEGEMIVVPRGVEHRPVAGGVAEILLFEPASTCNTGNVINDLTRGTDELDRL